MKKLLTTLVLLGCGLSYGNPLYIHKHEIGLYQSNKKTNFIKDVDILSPKSALFINDQLYINALEKGATVIYDTISWTKKEVLQHTFNNINFSKKNNYPYEIHNKSFIGKPVEFANDDKSLWISFYRFDWDKNSQHGSAIAQYDLNTKELLQIIPSGSIPKIITMSSDFKQLASTHWGDNSIGLYEKLYDNYNYYHINIEKPLNIKAISGNRDKNCGYCLRGTVFTPDNKYLIVSRMGGGGLAFIDVVNKKYIGSIFNVPLTPRHLVLSPDNKTLYLSTVASGEVSKIDMSKIYNEIQNLEQKTKPQITLKDWKSLKLNSGVRTIALSHDEKYLFATLNSTSELAIIDTQSMKVLEKHKVASFPVGLAVSKEDKYLAVTSQGKEGLGGGNHVDIFELQK